MSKNQEWWVGLAKELQKDIELENQKQMHSIR